MNNRFSRFGLGLGLAAVIAAGSVVPAFAADTVTQEVVGSPLTASITDLALSSKATSFAAQSSTGTMQLAVSDPSGLGDGWNVTVSSSAFVGAGNASGQDIPNSAFSIGTPATPTSGQSLVGVSAGAGGSLDSARKVISATAGNGMGSYAQDLPITLVVPANAYTGDYTASLTVTEASGPGI